MPFIHDDALDALLSYVDVAADNLHLCTQEPTTYTEAVTTYRIATKTGVSIGSPANGTVNGRRVTVAGFVDGIATSTASATHWAIVDTSGSGKLLAAGPLASTLGLTNSAAFALPDFDISVPDAVTA